MPQDVISFSNSQETSWEELGGANSYAFNVVIDGKGVVHKRPGIGLYAEAPSTVIHPSGISGIRATNDGQLFALDSRINSRHIYKIQGGAAVDLSNIPSSSLIGNLRPYFTETEELLVMSGGLDMQKVTLATDASTRLGGSPPFSSHVVANSSRLLANDLFVDKTKVRYSNVNGQIGGTGDIGYEDWTVGVAGTAGFFTAEARPDNVVAIGENTNEVFVFGQDNVQVFVPDSSLIFAPAATREFGCLAPYSVVKKEQDFFWLDHRKQFIYSDGREFKVISGPIQGDLSGITTFNDCFGYRVFVGHVDCIVWTFPTDGRTFVYQIGGGWSQWAGWDSGASQFKLFTVSAHELRRDNAVNVVGTYAGKVGQLSLTSTSDLGEIINSQVTSAFLDRTTDTLKQCVNVKIAARRGSNSTAPIGTLEYRNQTGGWSEPLTVNFGSTNDRDIIRIFRSLGTYRRRQWRFTFSADSQLSLVKVTEEFKDLEI